MNALTNSLVYMGLMIWRHLFIDQKAQECQDMNQFSFATIRTTCWPSKDILKRWF